MKKILLTTVVASLLFISCKKDDDKKEEASTSRTEMLAGTNSKSWSIDKFTINGEDVTHTWIEACDKDNVTSFFANGNLTFDEGATKCDSNSAQTEEGTWRFVNNETSIVMTSEDLTDTANIGTLTNNTLSIVLMYDDTATAEVFYKVN